MYEGDSIKNKYEQHGRALAIQLLSEIEECGSVQCAIEPEFRERTEQNNVVLKYLEHVQRTANQDIKKGFSAVLTDYLCATVEGGIPDLEIYSKEVWRHGEVELTA